jgi:hypothetical protein
MRPSVSHTTRPPSLATTRLAALAILLAGTSAGGCASEMQWPPGFVEVDRDSRGPFTQRAVSADGVVVALRAEPNPKDATVDFWVSAVREELVNRRGYTLAKEEAATSADGAPGKLLTFTAQRSGVEFTYVTALYVKGREVLVGEAGGKTEAFTPKADAIRKCLTGLRAGGV